MSSSEPTTTEEDELSDGPGVGPLLGSSSNGRGNGELLVPSGEKKEGRLARAFHSFVAWTFLLAVVSAFVLLMLMKASFLAFQSP